MVLALLTVSACGTLSRMQVDPTDQQAKRLATNGDLRIEVDELAQPLIDTQHTPGLMIGVLTADGQKHFFGYGLTRANGTQPDSSTLFAIGSLSKGFVGDITALMVQDGTLNWADTLEALLPADIQLSDDAKQITLLQLATHTSGLPRQPMTPTTLSYFIEYLFTGNSFYKDFDRDYLLDYLADFVRPKSLDPQYSNIGYGLLTYVLEQHSGEKIDQLLQIKVARPLGLSNTDYVAERLSGYADRARGHAGDQPKFIRRGEPVPDWAFTDILHGTAALYSNADDLLSYAAAHLYGSTNPLINAALQDTLQVRAPRKQEAAAINWMVDEVGGQTVTYQVGLVAGYSSYIGLDTQHKTAVVVLQNSFNWDSIGHRLLVRMATATNLQAGR